MTPISIRVQKSGKAVLTAALIVLTACSNDLVREEILSDKGCFLTLNAQKGGTTTDTRGLNLPSETSDINAIWSEGDYVTVLSTTGQTLGTMVPTSTGSATTKLKAKLNTPVSYGDQLTLVFPRTTRDYTGQKGTLADIAAKYDYATASVTVNYADDSFVSATDAHFLNQQAIVKFKLMDGTKALNATSMTIAADGLLQNASTPGPVTITPETATNEIYTALSGINGTVTLTAIAGNKTYTSTSTTSHTFSNGKYYVITAPMQKPSVSYPEPLTLECFNSTDGRGCYVTVTDYHDLEYTTDGGATWTEYTRSIYLAIGKKISFRGERSTDGTGSSNYMNIQCNGDCYIYGNVMSLLSKDNYATMTELPYDHTFQNLFKDNQFISHAEGKDLVLPATELRKNCYFQMFSGCVNFNYIKCLATDIPSGGGCTTNWLKSTARKGTFVKAEGFNDWTSGDSGIPQGWTVIEE